MVTLALAILLTWTDTHATGATYHVYRAGGACSAKSVFERLTAVPVTSKRYEDATGATGVGSFCYRVTALVADVESDPSAAVSITLKPAAPTGLKAEQVPATLW